MPRKPREKSASNIYHIIWRGANKQDIFHDDEDRVKFQDTLEKYHQKYKITILGWCLMSNHTHLLIKEGIEDISVTMKRIGVSYALYFNRKYYTVGHLFQNRFSSEKVENDSYLLTVTRYIHQNPTKAGMVQRPDQWKWSSCRGYYGQDSPNLKMLNPNYVLKLFSNDLHLAREKFKEYNEKTNNDQCLEEPTQIKKRLNDRDAKKAIKTILGTIEIPQVKSLPRDQRLPLLRKIKRIEGISQRQAARILGISANLIFKA
ncbi:transposase [Sutcliffiella horikoshii]|uniref:transposase n=1 Tax=Sutcliffiella horikoshii TaxID=79883 RepID=UPI00384D7307